MYLQAARYLVKALAAAQTGRSLGGGSARYLGDARREMGAKCEVATAQDWRNPAHQLAALRWGWGWGQWGSGAASRAWYGYGHGHGRCSVCVLVQ